MKANLKNFPDWDLEAIMLWKKEIIVELREQFLPRILDAMAELVDDRSDFQKGYKIGFIDAIKKILGEA